MLLLIAIGLLGWFVVSCVFAPLIGGAIHRCDVLARRRSVEVLRSRAQHPATHAA
ncbi:MAG: hypothetical protein JOZ68_06615 [Acidimicrobiia bacterium]|nr:hypothetical protein [Acidimicrobiia bacterium]MBV9040657.1 hypothetical protein [Acidimicrobiia bacterium]MBV9283677.1 hypothetical protein [Acidimicrobiia bacterium]